MGRNPCCSKVGLKKGAWTAAEDKLLTDYIKVHGDGNWRALPKRAGLERCGKSCRLRWLNYLRPDIKRGNITEDEEDLIIRLHKLLGNRWSLIAGRLPGRTDNEIKNYWNTTLGKRVHDQSNSASTVKHSKQSSDKKKRTGMASRTTPKPRRFSKDSCNSNKMETGFTDRLLSPSPDEDNSLTKPNQTKLYSTRRDQLDEESSLTKPNQTKLYPTRWGHEDNRLSEYITLEELHVSGFINPGLTGLLDFSYGNGHGHGHGIALSSSLYDDCLMTSDEMLEDWTKSDLYNQKINSDGFESHSRV